MPQRSNIVGDLGTTKLASDSYDVDNIYLTEEGWVYRHYKSTDGSRYWDEILVAGEVVAASNSPCQATNPPKLGTVASPTFETGDGTDDWTYSVHQETGFPGTYTTKIVTEGGGLGVGDGQVAPVADIGDITGTAPSGQVLTGVASAYTVTSENPAGVTFTWTTSDGDGVLSATTGTSVNITWVTPGAKTVTVTATKAGASDTGSTKTYNQAVNQFTIGNVTNTGGAQIGESIDHVISAIADGNVDDLTYAWAVTGGTGNAADVTFSDPTSRSTNFNSSSSGTYQLTCTVSSVKAGGVSGDGTGSKTTQADVTVGPADVQLELTGADGTNSYTSAGGANASVSIQAGGTLTIINDTGGHPVTVRVADEGATVSTGTLTGAPANDGEVLSWDTTGVTPGTYYYQCTSHPTMIGEITVTA